MGAKGKILEEKEKIDYRSIEALNQSGLKIFDEDPMAFYRQYILKIRTKRKSTDAFLIGDLADFYTLDCEGDEDIFNQRLEEKFTLFEGAKGSGQVFKLADVLADITERDTNEKGEVTTSFITRFTEAFAIIQTPDKAGKSLYSGKMLSQGMEDFDKNGRDYFDKKVLSFSRDVVTLKHIEIAKRVGNQLLTDPFTAWVYKGEEDIEVYKKLPILWDWSLPNGELFNCKSEIDILHVDHSLKLIHIKDQKVTYDNELFEGNYLKYSYYLQNAFYYLAAEMWRKEQGMDDYTVVMGADFVVGDSSFNLRRPLIYRTSISHVMDGLNGFTTPLGYKYRGVSELINEISFCIDNSSWNCSREAYEHNGLLKLKNYT